MLVAPGSIPLGLDSVDMGRCWTLADHKAVPLCWAEAPSNRIMFVWWDEVAGLDFAYPIVVIDGAPAPIEQELAGRYDLQFHKFST